MAQWLEHPPLTKRLQLQSQLGHMPGLRIIPHLGQAMSRQLQSRSQLGSLVWMQAKAANRCFSSINVSLSRFLSLSPKKQMKNVLRWVLKKKKRNTKMKVLSKWKVSCRWKVLLKSNVCIHVQIYLIASNPFYVSWF